MAMGRNRTRDKDLPNMVRVSHGSYYFISRIPDPKRPGKLKNKWVQIGRVSELPIWQVHKWYAQNVDSRIANKSTLSNLFNEFEREHIPKLKNANTRQEYVTRLKILHEVFGMMAPNDLTKSDIKQFRHKRSLQKTIATANHDFGVLSSALTFGVDIGALDINPCLGIKKLKDENKPEKEYVTDEVLNAVMPLFPDNYKAAIWIYQLTGKRRTELLSRTKDHVTEEGIEFELQKKKNGKNNKQIVLWSDELREAYAFALSTHPHDFVRSIICRADGKGYTPTGFSTTFRRVVLKAIKLELIKEGEYFSIHDIRTKTSSDLDTDQDAARLLGHEDDGATARKHYRLKPSKVKPLR